LQIPTGISAFRGLCQFEMNLLAGGFKDLVSFTDKEGNAPKCGNRHHGIDNAGNDGGLTAAKPCDCVKTEQTDTAPVKTADDGENECKPVKHTIYILS